MWNKEIIETPDVSDVLLATRFLALKSMRKLTCSICDGKSWNVVPIDKFYGLVEMDDPSEFRTKSMNVLMIACSGCGHLHLFSKDKVKAVVESSLSSGQPSSEKGVTADVVNPGVAGSEGEEAGSGI